MNTKRLFSVLNTLLITGILFVANYSTAQTRQYATTVSSSATSVTSTTYPISRAVDGTGSSDLTTAARITTTTILGVGSLIIESPSHIELQFPTLNGNVNVAANTTVYVKINMEQANALQALVGGALGSLLNNLLGQQYLQVSARNSTGTTVFNSATFTDFAQERLRIVRDNVGNYYIKVTPNAAFNRIRIDNRMNGIVSTRWLDVYGAFYVQGNTGCALGSYTSYTASGVASISLTTPEGVTNPQYAIDGNATTYSNISLGTLGVASYIEQTVYFEGVPPVATDEYTIKLGINSSLLSLGILNGVQIFAYNGGNSTPVYSRRLDDNAFINLNLNTAITNGQPISIPILPGQVIDRITIRLNGLANLNALTNSIRLYEVTKGSFAVNVTGGGSFHQGVATTLTATVTGCNGPFTYSWSGNGLSGTGTTLNVPNTSAPGTYTYTVTVTDSYGVVKTGTATVIIEQPPIPGSITGATTVCTGDTPPTLTLTGYIGSIVRWERASTYGFASPTTIANTTATLPGSSIGAITSTVYVRALVHSATYADEYTTPVALMVKSTTWDGTAWSNGVPDIATTIYINGPYSENVDLYGCSLEVNNNAVVSIPTGRTVTLNKFIRVNAGSSVTFQNNAHLIQQTNAVNIGNITLKRNSSSLFRLDYTLWSSPVVGQQLLAFSPNTTLGRFYEYKYGYDATLNANVEQYFIIDPNTNFETAKSYLIRMPNSDVTPGYNAGSTAITYPGSFTGVPVNGIVTKALSTQGDRYTAIGNPYPSPINVHAFFDTNQTILDPTAALYFWRKKNNTQASSYATLTRDAYAYNHATGGHTGEDQYGGAQWATFFSTTPSNQWVINPGQGFIVRTASGATTPVVTFNNAMRRGDVHNPQFFRTATPDLISRLWVDMSNENTYSQAVLVYSNTATLGMDTGREGLALNNGGLISFYSVAEDNNLTIQARPEFSTADIVRMGYTGTAAGQYTIAVRNKDGVFESGQNIYLNDRLLNQITDITVNGYTFTTDAGTFNDRFEIIYSTQALGTTSNIFDANSLIVYRENNEINISAGNTLINEINVYDIRGSKLYSKNGINATTEKITDLQSSQQMLIIEVNTEKGKASKKIIF
ncbi:T9SS sorting signal type C domain-containing protein [Flavobacterium sp. Sd200]|uniref:T9SS sorting signal type C domain-containing protein n=1 Tax=Flavobacterium sp. Sd200 TaxID=2692211 RepID=UPI001369B2DE|nr:T9SS sorting signal type C domain-containing protein [Flavobacterium sp. Sd200]MXN92459.1 T9SS sorting signal type C domain-containing protein [Flavobacterium sp. Sd200]